MTIGDAAAAGLRPLDANEHELMAAQVAAHVTVAHKLDRIKTGLSCGEAHTTQLVITLLEAIPIVAPKRAATSRPQEAADRFLVAPESDGATDVDVQPRATCHVHPMAMLLIPAAATVRDLDPAAIRDRRERSRPGEPHLQHTRGTRAQTCIHM